MKRALAVLLAVFSSCCADLAAQGRSASQVRWWRGSFDNAFETAELRNVPVIVAIIQDGEEANERLVDAILKNATFAKMTEMTVPIVCSRKNHGDRRQDLDGRTLSACRRFGAVPCETHIAHEQDMYSVFFAGGKEVKTPQVIVCLPDQTVIDEIVDVMGLGDYRSAIRRGIRKLGPGITRTDYEAILKDLSAARRAMAGRRWEEAYAVAEDAKKRAGSAPLKQRVDRVIAALMAHANQTITKIREAIGRKDYWFAAEKLHELAAVYGKTPIAKKLRAIEKSLKKDATARRVLGDFKKQQRYMPLWKNARMLEKKREYVRALKAYRRIEKKARGLPLETRARDRIETMRKDPAIRELLDAAEAEVAAREMYKKAERLRRKGDTAAADDLYRKITTKYAGTEAAEKAARRLRKK